MLPVEVRKRLKLIINLIHLQDWAHDLKLDGSGEKHGLFPRQLAIQESLILIKCKDLLDIFHGITLLPILD